MPGFLSSYSGHDKFLQRILRRCGSYYQSGDLFYQRLWRERLTQIGFRVTLVEKLPYHNLWDIRCYGSLSAQSYLLLSKPLPKQSLHAQDILLKQLEIEVHQIARDLGLELRRDWVGVRRSGGYFKICFIWAPGKPGRWATSEKQPEAFSFLIRPWLKRTRN